MNDLLSGYLDFLSKGGLIPYFQQGLDKLRDFLGFPAPSTSPVGAPYTPPFSGGQCSKPYSVTFYQTYADGSTRYYIGNGSSGIGEAPTLSQKQNAFSTSGAISSISWSGGGVSSFGTVNILINGQSFYCNNIINDQSATGFGIYSIVTRDGSADNCGDLPNPNPAPSIADDGIAASAAPNFLSGAQDIINGSPLGDNGGGALADSANDDFNSAGSLSPSDIGGAIGKIAAGLSKLAQLLSLLNEILELLRKLLSKTNRTSFRYDFGEIRYDGFLQLYPNGTADKYQGQYVDIRMKSIRVGIGKDIGERSPHRYRVEPLGRIMFVSSTYGVLSTHSLEYVRNSIQIPALAFGMFYHLGLTGANVADCSAYYLKLEE